MSGSVFLGVSPTWRVSTCILSTRKSGYMTFCPCMIVSTIGSANCKFCSRLAYSTWDSIYLGVCLLEKCPLDSLATWHSSHVGVCPLMVLSTLGSAHVWFCLLGILSISVFVYLDSVRLEVWPHDIMRQVELCPLLILSTLVSANVWICLLGSQSTLVVVCLESVHLGV